MADRATRVQAASSITQVGPTRARQRASTKDAPARGRALVAPLLAIPLLATAAYFAYGRGFVNGDTMWALTWGDQLAHLHQPTFTAGTPTPHPLVNIATTLLSPLGATAEPAWHVIGYLSLAAMLYATWLLGAALFGPVAGVVAAVLVATRQTVAFYGPLAYLDFPYAALVIWAAALEARSPRRGTPVLALLTIAGLLRPEAWLLAGLYWLWLLPTLSRPRALRALALIATAPCLWVLFDLATTGDPTFSFSHTTNAGMEDRTHGLHDLIVDGPRILGQQVRPAIMVAAALGYLLTIRYDRHGRWLVAVTGATLLAFSVPVAAGTVANPRYLLPTVVLICVAAAACFTGWAGVAGRARVIWQAAAIVGLLAVVVTAIGQAERLRDLRHDVVAYRSSWDRLHRVVTGRVPCLPLTFANHRPFPMVAFWTGIDPGQLRDGVDGAPPTGSYLWGTPAAMTGVVQFASDATAPPPPPRNARFVRRQDGWTLRARCSS